MEVDVAPAHAIHAGGPASDAACPHDEVAWAVAAEVAGVVVPLLTAVGLPKVLRSAATWQACAKRGFRDERRGAKEGAGAGVEAGAGFLFDAVGSALLWFWEATQAAVIGSPVPDQAREGSLKGSLCSAQRCTWSSRRGVMAQLLEEHVPCPSVCERRTVFAEMPAGGAVREGLGAGFGALGEELKFSMRVLIFALQTCAIENFCLTIDQVAHLNRVL